MTQKTTAGVLASTEQTLATARAGLEDVTGSRLERRSAGLRNLVVFGRAVTNVLQNLRSTETAFDDWYRPYVAQMASDPLLKFLYKLRTEILKEGTAPTKVALSIKQFEFPMDMRKFGPPPANAGSFFIGDSQGGTGWEVALPDGSTAKYYVDLPGDIGEVSLHLAGAPTEHLGVTLADSRLETICTIYVAYLDRLVRAARQRFGGGA